MANGSCKAFGLPFAHNWFLKIRIKIGNTIPRHINSPQTAKEKHVARLAALGSYRFSLGVGKKTLRVSKRRKVDLIKLLQHQIRIARPE